MTPLRCLKQQDDSLNFSLRASRSQKYWKFNFFGTHVLNTKWNPFPAELWCVEGEPPPLESKVGPIAGWVREILGDGPETSPSVPVDLFHPFRHLQRSQPNNKQHFYISTDTIRNLTQWEDWGTEIFIESHELQTNSGPRRMFIWYNWHSVVGRIRPCFISVPVRNNAIVN